MLKTVGFAFLIVFLSISPANVLPPDKNFGNIIVDEALNVWPDLSFSCNVSQWPPIIGENIRVKIGSVKPNPEINPEKVTEFLNQFLKASENRTIILLNIRRGETFSIIADVFINGENLARKLLEGDFALKTEAIEAVPGKGVLINPDNNSEKLNNKPGDSSQKVSDTFVGSKNSKVFHRRTCRYAATISSDNLVTYKDKESAQSKGKRPCKSCLP